VPAFESDGYTVLDFGNQKLVFSKTTNNKPLTTFKMTTSQPCLNPYEQPYNKDRHFFIGEVGSQATQCVKIMSVGGEGLTLDSRYRPAGLKGINQYDLEKESGVL